MTSGFDQFFNLPPLDSVLKKQGIDVNTTQEEEPEIDIKRMSDELRNASKRAAMIEGTDHSEALDEMHKEILSHARDLMSFGFNTDQRNSARIFEMASLMYGHAISAKNAKRDAQLKAMKLALDRRKVELEEKKVNAALGDNQAATIQNGMIVVEDRNELIKRLREQMKNGVDQPS